MKVPKTHPRFNSLQTRALLEKGVTKGITSLNGLIAHGRGEAFDYLLGEKTHSFSEQAIEAAVAMLLLAKHPIISVNGNTAMLVPKEFVQLAKILDAPLEINLFHPSENRFKKIKKNLEKSGATKVLLPDKKYKIAYLDSPRRYVNSEGIYNADVVFVPLEDGDRTEALIKNGKKVITVDLNPLSRTSRKATITIVDNIIRALPLLVIQAKQYRSVEKEELQSIIRKYNNKKMLEESVIIIKNSNNINH